MNEPRRAVLGDRAVLALGGGEVREFLQGLVSNDVERLGTERAIYAALLTPQGKYLFDFFLADTGDGLLLEGEAARLAPLAKRLAMYRLRADVTIEEASDFAVHAVFGEGAAEALDLPAEAGAARLLEDGGVAFVDCRDARAGVRLLGPVDAEFAHLPAADAEDYDRHRLALGLPDGSRDLEVERSILLEADFEALNGVDFKKGCYVGQEVTARTKHRGLVRKRLLRVAIEGPLPAPGTPILAGGREVGTLRSGRDDRALALLRLDAVDAGPEMTAEASRVRPLSEVAR